MKTTEEILEYIETGMKRIREMPESLAVSPLNLKEWATLRELKDFITAKEKVMTCPDGGACHHRCKDKCFRVKCCSPLSGVYKNDKWPDEETLALDELTKIAQENNMGY